MNCFNIILKLTKQKDFNFIKQLRKMLGINRKH